MHIEQPNIDGEWIAKVASTDFEEAALSVYRFQYAHNAVYRNFANYMSRIPASVHRVTDIPFLPIRFFKTHQVVTTTFEPETMFESSGTTGETASRHLVKNAQIYRDSFRRTFTHFYDDVRDWAIIGLLPSYLERKHSSLVFMVDDLVQLSQQPESGFYLYDTERLIQVLRNLQNNGRKVLLIGVTFALLDLADKYQVDLQHVVVMETGGMKGRREEMTREAVHQRLIDSFGVSAVHSEYGMTELLSQAYSPGKGIFLTPSWMKILVRQEDDPLTVINAGKLPADGLINVIDLANLYSCAFIATDDVGRLHPDGSFEVSGRMDASDIRGCSLLTA